jgi:hypothetical protein
MGTKRNHGNFFSGCDGKVSFSSPNIAKKAACRKASRDIYRCNHCGHWHVGNNSARRAARIKPYSRKGRNKHHDYFM